MLWQFYYDNLSKGIDKGFKDFGKITVDTSDLREALKNDIAKFSAFKETGFRNALLDIIEKKAILPTRKEFREKALAVNNDYNKIWLDTELDLTVAKAKSAVQWKDYESRKHLYPNIRYTAVHDGRSRSWHLKYDGLILPLDHPFWKTHLPPWDYGCRCGTDQTDDEVDDKDIDFNDQKAKPGLGNNPGVTGKIVADDHPYYNVSEADKKETLNNLDHFNESRFTPKYLKDYESKLGVEIDKSMFSLLQKETPLYLENPKGYEKNAGAYYAPLQNFVKIPIDARRKKSPWYAKAVVHHEYGHAIDWQIGLRKSKRIGDLMDEARKLHTKAEFSLMYDKAVENHIKADIAGEYDNKEKYGAIIDTIASLHNSINKVQSHRPSYWKVSGNSEAEFIAHLFENKFAQNDAFEEMMPALYKMMVDFDLMDANGF